MNHGVRKFWILWTFRLLNFMEFIGTFPCLDLLWTIHNFIAFLMQFLLFHISTQFGLISFDKGGN